MTWTVATAPFLNLAHSSCCFLKVKRIKHLFLAVAPAPDLAEAQWELLPPQRREPADVL